MKENLFVPSSPEQAEQVIAELGALLLRNGNKPLTYPHNSVPQCIRDRHIIPDFELQLPANAGGINPYVTVDAEGTRLNPLAGLGVSQELSTPYIQSLSEVSYSVTRSQNRATGRGELQLQVETTFDTQSLADLVDDESGENEVNQALRDIDAFRRKMAENPLAVERELENILSSPTVGDLVLSDDQKQRMHPAPVPYQEADILIGFIASIRS